MIAASIYENHRDPKARSTPFDAREFDPYERAAFLQALEDAIPEATDEDLERIL